MTYAEKLGEVIKATGHRPGEMNKPKPAGACGFPVRVDYENAHVVKACALKAGHDGECAP